MSFYLHQDEFRSCKLHLGGTFNRRSQLEYQNKTCYLTFTFDMEGTEMPGNSSLTFYLRHYTYQIGPSKTSIALLSEKKLKYFCSITNGSVTQISVIIQKRISFHQDDTARPQKLCVRKTSLPHLEVKMELTNPPPRTVSITHIAISGRSRF